MAFSKVIFNDVTLMDVTQDTVAVDNLGESYTAHSSSGAGITGTADIVRHLEEVPDVKDTSVIIVDSIYYLWK